MVDSFGSANKVKVCFISASHFRTDIRMFQKQALSLQKAGYDVSVLVMDNYPNEITEGIKIIKSDVFWLNRIKVLLFAKYIFLKKAIQIDADIYQLQSPECISLGLALKKKGKKIVYDSEEDLPNLILIKDWIPKPLRVLISSLVKLYFKISLKNFDLILSPHDHVVHSLSRINKNTHLITNFPLLSNKVTFTEQEYILRDPTICYTGTVYPYSNQEAVLDAIDNIDNVKYNIAGSMSSKIEVLFSKYFNVHKINYVGMLNKVQLQEFYLKNRLGLVILDYCEYLGSERGTLAVNKIFEYMESGLPFICTNYDLWHEIIEEFECGICVEPGNVSQIRDAIIFLLNNPNIAYQMGQNGRKAVIEKFNWKSQEKVYLNIFLNLNN